MAARTLDDIGQTQTERFFHIDFHTFFLGAVRRGDVVARFGVAEAAARWDLALYRALAPENLAFNGSRKIYEVKPGFAPLFRHESENSLHALASGIGDDAAQVPQGHLRVKRPMRPASHRST